MCKPIVTRETTEDNELFKAERVTTVTMEYTPNIDAITIELNDYLSNNTIDGEWFKLVDINLTTGYGFRNTTKFVMYDLVHFTPPEERDTEEEKLEPDSEWTCEIDESFMSDDKFDDFIAKLEKKYKSQINHPGGYCPK